MIYKHIYNLRSIDHFLPRRRRSSCLVHADVQRTFHQPPSLFPLSSFRSLPVIPTIHTPLLDFASSPTLNHPAACFSEHLSGMAVLSL